MKNRARRRGGDAHGGIQRRGETLPEEGDSACSYVVGTCGSAPARRRAKAKA